MSVSHVNYNLSSCPVVVATERLLLSQNINKVVRKNASDPYFGVEQLAQILKMSKGALVRKCLISTNQKPCKYILTVRLQLAANLLISTDEPLQNVAWDSGFLSYSGFWRAFGSMYDTTPSGYRLSFHKNRYNTETKWSIPVDLNTRKALAKLVKEKSYIRFMFKTLLQNIKNEKFNLDTLAEVMDSSPSQLTRKLKSNMKVTPMKLLQHLRLLCAANLLSDTSQSVVQIANQTGFFDQAHLCKKFKTSFKCSPSSFRKNNHQEDFIIWLEKSLKDK